MKLLCFFGLGVFLGVLLTSWLYESQLYHKSRETISQDMAKPTTYVWDGTNLWVVRDRILVPTYRVVPVENGEIKWGLSTTGEVTHEFIQR